MTSKTNSLGWSGNSSESSLWQVLSGRLNDLEQQLVLLRTDLYEAVNTLKNKNQEVEALRHKIQAAEQRKASAENGRSEFPKISAPSKKIEPEETVEKLVLQSDCATLSRKIQEMEAFFSDYGLMLIKDDALQKTDFDDIWVRKTNIHYTPNFDKIFMVVEELNLTNAEPQIVKKGNSAQFKSVDLLNLTLYADGMQLESNPFRPYDSQSVQDFFIDLEDGYFPTELKERHPEGVIFKVEDKRKINFADDSNHRRFIGNGKKVGGPITSASNIVVPANSTSASKTGEKLDVPCPKDIADSTLGDEAIELDSTQNKFPSVKNSEQVGDQVGSSEDKLKNLSERNDERSKGQTKNRSSSLKKSNTSRRRSNGKRNNQNPTKGQVETTVKPIVVKGESHEIPTKEEVAVDPHVKPVSAKKITEEASDPLETNKEPRQNVESRLKQLFSASSPQKSLEQIPREILEPNSPIGSGMVKWPRLPVPPASPIHSSNASNSLDDQLIHRRYDQKPVSSVGAQTGSSLVLKNNAPCAHTCQPVNVTNFTYNEAPITVKMTADELLENNLPIKTDHSTQSDSSASATTKLTPVSELNSVRIPGETEYRDKFTGSAIISDNSNDPAPAHEHTATIEALKDESEVSSSGTETNLLKTSKVGRRLNSIDTAIKWENFTYLGHPKGQEPERTRLKPQTSNHPKQKSITTTLNEKTSDRMLTMRMRTESGDKEYIAHVFPEDPVNKLWSLLRLNGNEHNLMTADNAHLVKRGSIGKNSNGKDLTLIISKKRSNSKPKEHKSEQIKARRISTRSKVSEQPLLSTDANEKDNVGNVPSAVQSTTTLDGKITLKSSSNSFGSQSSSRRRTLPMRKASEQPLLSTDADEKDIVGNVPPAVHSSITLDEKITLKSPSNSLGSPSTSRKRTLSIDKVKSNKIIPVKTVSSKRISQTTNSSIQSNPRAKNNRTSNLSFGKSRPSSATLPLTPKKRADSLAQHLSTSTLRRTSYKRMSYKQLEAISEKDELLMEKEVEIEGSAAVNMDTKSNQLSENPDLNSLVNSIELPGLSLSANGRVRSDRVVSAQSDLNTPATTKETGQPLSNNEHDTTLDQQLVKSAVQSSRDLPVLPTSPVTNRQNIRRPISGKSVASNALVQMTRSGKNSTMELRKNTTVPRLSPNSSVNLKFNQTFSNGKGNLKKFEFRNKQLSFNASSNQLSIKPNKLSSLQIQIKRQRVDPRNVDLRNFQRATNEKRSMVSSAKQVRPIGPLKQKLSTEIGRFVFKSNPVPPNQFRAIAVQLKAPPDIKKLHPNFELRQRPKPITKSSNMSEFARKRLLIDVSKVNATPSDAYRSHSVGKGAMSTGCKPKIAMPGRLSLGMARKPKEFAQLFFGPNKNAICGVFKEKKCVPKKRAIVKHRNKVSDKPTFAVPRSVLNGFQNARINKLSQLSLSVRARQVIPIGNRVVPQRNKPNDKHALFNKHTYDNHVLKHPPVKSYSEQRFQSEILFDENNQQKSPDKQVSGPKMSGVKTNEEPADQNTSHNTSTNALVRRSNESTNIMETSI